MPTDSTMCRPLQRRLFVQCSTILFQLLTGHCYGPTLCFGQNGPPIIEDLFFSSKSKGKWILFFSLLSKKGGKSQALLLLFGKWSVQLLDKWLE